MTMRPCSSTPPVTCEAWGRPSDRWVMSTIECRGRTKSSSASRSTSVVVAIWRGMSVLLGSVAGVVEDRDERLGQPGGIHLVGPAAASHEAVVDLRGRHGPDDVDEVLAVEPGRQAVRLVQGVQRVGVAGPTLPVDGGHEV